MRWAVTGSNRRPPACKAGALPAELTARPPNDTGGRGLRRAIGWVPRPSVIGSESRRESRKRSSWPRSGRISPANAPSGIRTRATTLKGWRPRPLVDGGGRARIAVERPLELRRIPFCGRRSQAARNRRRAAIVNWVTVTAFETGGPVLLGGRVYTGPAGR